MSRTAWSYLKWVLLSVKNQSGELAWLQPLPFWIRQNFEDSQISFVVKGLGEKRDGG